MAISRILFLILCTLHLPLFAADSGFKKKSMKQMKEITSESLKDPFSAQFRKEKFKAEMTSGEGDDKRKLSVLCGEINGKNSYGGYDGFVPFISLSDHIGSVVFFKDRGVVSGKDAFETTARLEMELALLVLEKERLIEGNGKYKSMSEEDRKDVINKLHFKHLSDRYCK